MVVSQAASQPAGQLHLLRSVEPQSSVSRIYLARLCRQGAVLTFNETRANVWLSVLHRGLALEVVGFRSILRGRACTRSPSRKGFHERCVFAVNGGWGERRNGYLRASNL